MRDRVHNKKIILASDLMSFIITHIHYNHADKNTFRFNYFYSQRICKCVFINTSFFIHKVINRLSKEENLNVTCLSVYISQISSIFSQTITSTVLKENLTLFLKSTSFTNYNKCIVFREILIFTEIFKMLATSYLNYNFNNKCNLHIL